MSDVIRRTRSEAPRSHGDLPDRAWLFHVFSCEAPTAPPLAACHLDDFDEVEIGRSGSGVAQAHTDGRRLELRFPDEWISTQHARIERGPGGLWVRDAGSKNGLWLNGERVDRVRLADGDWLEAGHTLLRYRYGDLQPLDPQPSARFDASGAFSTALPSLEVEFRELELIARSKQAVMLLGETGTGKEVMARAVHQLSGRPGDLIAVNCGALNDLVESQLFGHLKGAFSGAIDDRPGFVRAAHRGTLFLDEIGDLPSSAQAALLRVLQESEVTPVGGTRPVKVDLRVISATHRDLEALVDRGQFRADLYARLLDHRFVIPPLRERREDLGLLTAALLRRIAPDHDVQLELEAARALCWYDWKLNVRELEKRLKSAVLLSRGARMSLKHLSIGACLPARVIPSEAADHGAEQQERLRERLVAALREHRGNVTAVARAFGKARSQVQRWMRKYGLSPADYH